MFSDRSAWNAQVFGAMGISEQGHFLTFLKSHLINSCLHSLHRTPTLLTPCIVHCARLCSQTKSQVQILTPTLSWITIRQVFRCFLFCFILVSGVFSFLVGLLCLFVLSPSLKPFPHLQNRDPIGIDDARRAAGSGICRCLLMSAQKLLLCPSMQASTVLVSSVPSPLPCLWGCCCEVSLMGTALSLPRGS